jgi:hypothetical protein
MKRLAYAAGGALLFCSLCLAEDPPRTTGDATEVRGIDFKVLAEAFDTNEARADLLYVDKRVTVSGEVVRVVRPRFARAWRGNGKDEYLLELKAPPTRLSDVRILFLFNEEERGQLADLQPGQKVILQGQCGQPAILRGLPGAPEGSLAVTVRDCKLLKGK